MNQYFITIERSGTNNKLQNEVQLYCWKNFHNKLTTDRDTIRKLISEEVYGLNVKFNRCSMVSVGEIRSKSASVDGFFPDFMRVYDRSFILTVKFHKVNGQI